MRRLLLVFALVLAGCGSDQEPAVDDGAARGGAFPAKVEHKFGTTTVPAKPERIVVVGLTEQDTVLALGYKPIATTEWYGDQPYAVWPWAREALGDAKPSVLSAVDGFQFEKIAGLRPDLIIGVNSGMKRADYDKLSRLAPTVPAGKGSTEQPSDVAALKKVPTFDHIPAVADNRAVYTDGTLAGAIYFISPLSLPYVLERLTPQLEAAAGGAAAGRRHRGIERRRPLRRAAS